MHMANSIVGDLYEKIRDVREMKSVPAEVQSQAVACLSESPHLDVPAALAAGRERLAQYVKSRQEE